MRPRVIPVLSVASRRLVKTVRFGDRTYIGDPINTMRIFSELSADEVMVLDIDAGNVDEEYVRSLAEEAVMPMAYGGGVRHVNCALRLVGLGVEKIVVTTALHSDPDFCCELSREVGVQSVIGGIDVKTLPDGTHAAWNRSRGRVIDVALGDYCKYAVESGAGELLLNCMDRDGTRLGPLLDALEVVARSVDVPIIYCGGVGSREDAHQLVKNGASAVGIGSVATMLNGPDSVLVSYPFSGREIGYES